MRPGLGYLTFAALCLLASVFAERGGLPWVSWGCVVVGAGLGLVGARRL
jgi:hypothetical protein